MESVISEHSLLLRNLPRRVVFEELKKAGDQFGEKPAYVVLPPPQFQPSSKGSFALVDFGSPSSMRNAHLDWTMQPPECFGAAARVQADARGKMLFQLCPGVHDWLMARRRIPSRHGGNAPGAGRPPARNPPTRPMELPQRKVSAFRAASGPSAGLAGRAQRYVGPEQLRPPGGYGREASMHRAGFRDRDELRDRHGELRRDTRQGPSAAEDGRGGFRDAGLRGYEWKERDSSRMYENPGYAGDTRGRADEGSCDLRDNERGPRRVDGDTAPRELPGRSRSDRPVAAWPPRSVELFAVQVILPDDESERTGRTALKNAEVSDFFRSVLKRVSPGNKLVTTVPTGLGFSCGFESRVVRDKVWSHFAGERHGGRDRATSQGDADVTAIRTKINGFPTRLTLGMLGMETASRTPSASTVTPSRGASSPPPNRGPSPSAREHSSGDTQPPSARNSGVLSVCAPRPGGTHAHSTALGRSSAALVAPASEAHSGRIPRLPKSGESQDIVRRPSSPPVPPPRVKPPAGNPPRKARSLRFSAKEHGEELAYVYEQLSADLVKELLSRVQPVLNRASAESVRIGKEKIEKEALQSSQREKAEAKKRREETEAAMRLTSGMGIELGLEAYLASDVAPAGARSLPADESNSYVPVEARDEEETDARSREPSNSDSGAARDDHQDVEGDEGDEDHDEHNEVKIRSRRGKSERDRASRKRHRKLLDSDGEEISDGDADADLDDFAVSRTLEREKDVCCPPSEFEGGSGKSTVLKSKKRSNKSKSSKSKKDKQTKRKKRKTQEEESDHVSNASDDGHDEDRDLEHTEGAVSPSTMLDDTDSPSLEEPMFEQDGSYEPAKQFAPYAENVGEDDGDGKGDQEEAEEIDDGCESLNLKDGSCARTAGFFKTQLRKSKATILPEELELQLQERVRDAVQQAEATGTSARGNRSAVRKLRQGLNEASLGAETMAMSYLSQRQKRMTFAKSRIHGMGLYSLEDIPAGEFLIEYVGEVIRRPLSDCREKGYAQAGMGDSYLFRLTADLVVDATRKGSIARFINHSCEPSVEARIIIVNGAPKIVFYTKRAVKCGEELTYDYQFAYEDEESKVACFCGAPSCRKSLN